MSTSISITGTSSMVTANGLRHRVLRYGSDGHGHRDLLVLPGITSPAVTIDFLAVHLAELDYRVTVPDIRGRGETDRAPSGHYRLTDYAADVAGLIAALDLDRPVVLGHSMGARIAAAYAVLHPGPDHGPLVLVDPPMSGPGRAPYPTSREAFAEQLRQARRGTTADEVAAFYPGWPRRELQLRAEVLASCDETAVVESHAGLESEDFLAYWNQLPTPAVLVRGGESPVVPESAVEELRARRPDIDLVTVPRTGHMIPWDDRAGFLDAVRPYLTAYRTQ